MATETYYSNIFFTNGITLRLCGKYKTLEDAKKEKQDADFGAVEIVEIDGVISDFSIKLKYKTS